MLTRGFHQSYPLLQPATETVALLSGQHDQLGCRAPKSGSWEIGLRINLLISFFYNGTPVCAFFA